MDTRLQEGIIGFLLFVVGKENQTANFICKWGNSLMCKTVVRSALPFFFFLFFFFFFAWYTCHCNYNRKKKNNNNNNNTNNNNHNNHNHNRIERHNSRYICTISSLCCKLYPTPTLKWPERSHMQITCNTSSTFHVALRATWYEVTAQLLSLTEFKWHLFELHFIGWTINQWRRGGNRDARRKPLATSFTKCHILKPEDSSPKRDSNPHNSIGGRLGNQTC